MSIASLHVWLDKDGIAWIDDTNVKVIEIALDQIAHGLSVDEIFEQYGRLLSLAQIHSALAYYYDHAAELDSLIADQVNEYESLHEQAKNSPLRKRLRSLGKLQ